MDHIKTFIFAIGVIIMLLSKPSCAEPGDFEHSMDIGQVSLEGSAGFDSETGQYQITGAGENM